MAPARGHRQKPVPWQVAARRQRCRWRRRRRAHPRRRGSYLIGFELLGQDKTERAALPWRALDLDLPAQQPRQVTRDRQPQTGAAVTAVTGAIDLMEGVEDRLVLVGRDADAGVTDCEDDTTVLLLVDGQADFSVLGELDGVGQQVLQDLLSADGR